LPLQDKDCVDEVLAMEPVKVKFAKRKLRVQRCKSVPGTSLKIKTAPPPSKKDASSSSQPRQPRQAPVAVPKGDPRLGEKLAGLSKEVRKEVKSKDADRVARRLAKKKARMSMGSKPAGALQGRDRDRSRKTGAAKSGINPGKKMGKPRVRSEKSMAKRNGKKT
jgi:nucleolar protein 12